MRAHKMLNMYNSVPFSTQEINNNNILNAGSGHNFWLTLDVQLFQENKYLNRQIIASYFRKVS